jgi:hypothetical protein
MERGSVSRVSKQVMPRLSESLRFKYEDLLTETNEHRQTWSSAYKIGPGIDSSDHPPKLSLFQEDSGGNEVTEALSFVHLTEESRTIQSGTEDRRKLLTGIIIYASCSSCLLHLLLPSNI